jgi:hypothetical protein
MQRTPAQDGMAAFLWVCQFEAVTSGLNFWKLQKWPMDRPFVVPLPFQH